MKKGPDGTLPLFDEGAGLFEVNPSRLQCYLDCPRQYRFRYVERRPERKASQYAALGRSVHKALRDFYALPPSERTLDNLMAGLRRAWDPSGFPSRTAKEDGMARAEDMLRRFYESEDHGAVRPLALESKFSYSHPMTSILVTGRVDRLDKTSEGYVIVDYKTGTFRETEESIHESLPLSLYAMAVGARLGRDVSRIVLHHLASGQRWETVRDTERLSDDWRALVEIVDRMRADEEFKPEPGRFCRSCDYLELCPEGREETGGRLRSAERGASELNDRQN